MFSRILIDVLTFEECMSENLEDPAYLELVEKLKHDELLVSFSGYSI